MMCYSAKVQANYEEYVRHYGADMEIETFRRLYFARAAGTNIRIPKALDAALLNDPVSDDIAHAISDYQNRLASELEAELFTQRSRLAAAERKPQAKVSKSATEDVRISTDKIAPRCAPSTISTGVS